MVTEISRLSSKEVATYPFLEPDESNSHSHPISPRSILILCSFNHWIVQEISFLQSPYQNFVH
jgi:hypothetical protein